MSKQLAFMRFAMAFLPLLTSGCLPNYGLSPRETRGNDFSALIYEGLPLPAISTTTAPAMPTVPFKIGVIQAGEVVPPDSMLKLLASKPQLLSRVDGLSGLYDGTGGLPFILINNATTVPSVDSDVAQKSGAAHRLAVDRMRELASSMGIDYLLLFGGTIDRDDGDTPLAVFNLTIVGLYLIPSRHVHADARASGALIDVRTGRVIMTLGSHAEAECLVPYASTGQALQGTADAVREQTIDALAKEFIRRLEKAK